MICELENIFAYYISKLKLSDQNKIIKVSD